MHLSDSGGGGRQQQVQKQKFRWRGCVAGLAHRCVPWAGWFPHQGGPLSKHPQLPQGSPPHRSSAARGSSGGHGPLQAGHQTPQAEKPAPGQARSAPPLDFPSTDGDPEAWRGRSPVQGVTTSKGQGQDWDPGGLGLNCHTPSSS